MKRIALISLTLIVLFLSCKKTPTATPTPTPQPTGDVTPPVITLKGKTNDTISLGSTYIDLGATATDNVDGDLTAFIIVSGSVSTATVGNYNKQYNVRDGAGNIAAQKTRTVTVKNDAGYLDGNYTAACGCTTTVGDNPPPTPTITNTSYTVNVNSSMTGNNGATISKYPNVNGAVISYNPLNFAVNGKGISFFITPGIASGTISSSGTSFTMTSTHYDMNYPSRHTDCKVIHTKN